MKDTHYTIGTTSALHWNKDHMRYNDNANVRDYFDHLWRYKGHDCDGVGLMVRDVNGTFTQLVEGDTVSILMEEPD